MATATIDIPCLRDTQLDSGSVGADNSAATSITIGMDAAGAKEHGIFSFDLAAIGSIPASRISAATLRLFVESSVASPGTNLFRLMSLPPAWIETANWDTYNGVDAWTTAGGDVTGTGSNIIGSAITTTVGGIMPVTVTSGLAAALAANQARADWLIRRSTETGNTLTWVVSSRNHATVAQRPILRITYTSPATALVASSGHGRLKQRIRRF